MSEKLAKKPALGRGLSALLAQAEDTYGTSSVTPALAGQVRKMGIDQLQPGKYQPRRRFNPEAITQLADSIRARGILQPILARSVAGGKFEIIAGERRWRAAQEAQLAEVPVLVQDFSDAEVLEIGLIENLQRADLNALEEAEAYKRLMDEFGHTQLVLAETVGKSRSHIANTLRLLSLPEGVKTMVITERLTAGHARALLNASDPVALAEKVIARGLSVRETERLAATPSSKRGEKPQAKRSADVALIEADLSKRLGLKVQITNQGSSGSVSIFFKDLDQFDDLLARLTQSNA
jgi:ParB family chromosome partitioning protein